MSKTHDGGEETYVGFCELVTDEIILALKDLLESVERVEERVNRLFVRGLRRRKAALVHTVCICS